MNREEFYLLAAPVFATYLARVSSQEALRYTASALEDVDERHSRELLLTSLTPNPGPKLVEDKLPVVRQFGFAVSQEEAGVPKPVLVSSFLSNLRAYAVGKLEAAMQQFTGLFSAMASMMFAPLLLLFLYAYGLFGINPTELYSLGALISLLISLLIYRAMPKDLSPRVYGPSLPLAIVAGAAVGALAYNYALPLALAPLVAGAVLTAWLLTTRRIRWYSLALEVPPMLRDFASRLSQGVPPDLAMREVAATYKSAWMIAYFYSIPSLLYSVAKAMYMAISWAGPNLEAVDYLQALLNERERAMRRVTSLAFIFIAVYLGASLLLAYSLDISTAALQTVPSTGQAILYPVSPQQAEYVVAQLLSLMTAGFLFSVLMPNRGAWLSLSVGGIAGVALFYSLGYLWAIWA